MPSGPQPLEKHIFVVVAHSNKFDFVRSKVGSKVVPLDSWLDSETDSPSFSRNEATGLGLF